jgi:DNA-binding NtrC family response regulator
MTSVRLPSSDESALVALVVQEMSLQRGLLEARQTVALAFECAYVRKVLEMSEGNITRASAHAGVTRKSFKASMDRCSIRETAPQRP